MTTGRHVRVQGYDHDGRTGRSMRTAKGFTKSDGRTVCGAPSSADDLGRKAGDGSLQLPTWRAELCPRCAEGLDALAERARRMGANRTGK